MMCQQPPNIKATIHKALVYFDCPQVIILYGTKKSRIIAVAVERDGMEYPFFSCCISEKNWDKYMEGKTDLRYLFDNAASKKYYFFDLNETEDNNIELILAQASDVKNDDYWPEKGFFSSSHTEIWDEYQAVTNTAHSLNIDGTWEPSDFSQFCSKLYDLYALFHVLNIVRDSTSSQQTISALRNVISTRLWGGGGSYIGIYSTLTGCVASINPLTLKRIQYASPGQIEFLGDSNVYNATINAISQFEQSMDVAKEAYKYIDNILSKEGLKTAPSSTEFSSDPIKNHVKHRAGTVLQSIGIVDPEILLTVCNNNILIYAKLVLSIYRRIKGAYNYFDEGRVQV